MCSSDLRVLRSYSTDITTWSLVISAAIEKARKYLGSKGRDEETGNAVEYSEGECYECICAAFNADLNYEEDPGDKPKLPTEEKDMQDYIDAVIPMEEF